MKKISTLVFALFSFHLLFSQAPTQAINSFQITDTLAWKISYTIDIPTTCDSAILWISTSSTMKDTLKKGINYSRGQWLGNQKVAMKIRKGTSSNDLLGLLANTTYYLTIFTFNNKGVPAYYNTPKSYTFKTKGKTIGNYYKGLDTNKSAFLSSLSNLLSNHILASYNDITQLVDNVYARDTFVKDTSYHYVSCDYSDIIGMYHIYYTYSFGFTNFSREHNLPKNWMNFRTSKNDSLVYFKEGADWHNLSIVQYDVNSARQDYIYANVSGSGVTTMGSSKVKFSGNYSDTTNAFEPKASYKGNAARCMFYQMVCYNGTMSKTWGLKTGLKSFAKYQNQELLKTWARADTPDNFEIARNEYIYSVQKNRNPFIDFPAWVDCISFNDLTLLKTCEGLNIIDTVKPKPVSITQNNQKAWDVWFFQEEGTDRVIVHFYNDKIEPIELKIYDLNGKEVILQSLKANSGQNTTDLNLTNLTKGHYIFMISKSNQQKIYNLPIH